MRILFVAMADSIHTSRWLSHIIDKGWDIHVFDFLDGSVNPEMEGVTTHTIFPPTKPDKLRDYECKFPFKRGHRMLRKLPLAVSGLLTGERVAEFIRLKQRLMPDLIHSLEMQHESYPVDIARKRLGGSLQCPWIYSSWGSDIYHFANNPEHTLRIKSVLTHCDYLITDCERDIGLARDNGFSGELLGTFPVSGSFDVKRLRSMLPETKTSTRKSVALKGYQNWAGRALIALEGLRKCSDVLKGFTVEVYLGSPEVLKAARFFSRETGVEVREIQHTTNIEIIKLFGRSRIAIGLNVTDGSPNTLLEAMIMGAFPIQSNTQSTGEWIVDGQNGYLVPCESADSLAVAVRRALLDDDLVDRANATNLNEMLKRIDITTNSPRIENIYTQFTEQSDR